MILTAIFGKDKKMRALKKNILILTVVLLAGLVPAVCLAAEDTNIRGDKPQGGRGRNIELNEERIEQAMTELAKLDSKKAEELEAARIPTAGK